MICSPPAATSWRRPCFTHIPFVVNRTFNTTLTERLQHLQQGWTRLVEMTSGIWWSLLLGLTDDHMVFFRYPILSSF